MLYLCKNFDFYNSVLEGPFSMTTEVRRDDQHFKAADAVWPRHYSTQLFKQLIARQRRPRWAFCGRYEQTVDDVYLRLPQLTTKGVWLGEREQAERRKKLKNKKKAIEHFSHLADIVVCLFVGCAGGVEECCIQKWIIGSAHQHRYTFTCSTGLSQIKDNLSRILFIRGWIRWLENPRILCYVDDVEWMVIVFHRCRC